VHVDIVPRLFDVTGPNVHVHSVEGVPLLGLAPTNLSRSSRAIKRAFDIAFATIALTLLGPVLLVIGLWVRLDSTGPAIFRQTRVGQDSRPFQILKFRTMVADAEDRKDELSHLNKHARPGGDDRMFKIEDDPRVTGSGRILRRYFIDELPQLVNVLRGEMSVIGPRPLIVDEASHATELSLRRLQLKPGMTGPWQVLGRSEIPFGEMVQLDYIYVTSWSLGYDIRLLFHTLPLLARGERAV
jgi:lipopolysaccharide/colanic/teichoic acid biosynthesis glycosyltransferase